MLAKLSRKNQLTLPKKAVEKLGFSAEEEKYVDVEIQGNTLVMKPVIVTVEEKIPEEQWEKFRRWALNSDENDQVFRSPKAATRFLQKRMKK